jgi:translocation and assembly module TamB
MAAPARDRRPERRKKRRDLGGIAAMVLCVLFALIGLVPLAIGLVVRTPSVERWAANKTSQLIRDNLRVDARYEIDVRPWPLAVALEDIVVDATDGGAPVLRVERAVVRPRFFSLLAGKVDVGHVEVVGPVVRAVVRDGKLQNLAYEVPASEPTEESGFAELPFEALTITDARVDAIVDDMRVTAHALDVDVTNEGAGAVEVALRASGGTVTRKRAEPGRPWEDALDEDVVCRIEARVRKDDKGVLVRRLNVVGSVDFDPDPGTRPACDLPEEDPRKLAVRIGGLSVVPAARDGELPSVAGRVAVRVPGAIVHRFIDIAHATGWVALELDVDDLGELLAPAPDRRLPTARGTIKAAAAGLGGKTFAERFDAELSTAGTKIDLKNVRARWGDGDIEIETIALDPFAKGVTLDARVLRFAGVEMTGILRDMGVHPNAHVGWTIERAALDRFGGTLVPLDLQGKIQARSKDFGIWDRPWRSKEKRRMFGVSHGELRGNFTVEPRGVNLRDFSVSLGRSQIYTSVLIGFQNEFALTVGKGTKIDLAELSPLVTVPITGMAEITAQGRGDFFVPVIEGDIGIEDLTLGGFRAGRVDHAHVLFKPLKVDLTEVVMHPPPSPSDVPPPPTPHRGEKGAAPQSVVLAPHLLLDFESGADILVDGDLDTRKDAGVRIKDFLRIFKFVEDIPANARRKTDPTFESLDGWARGTAHVRYALGGPEDRCRAGFLRVKTNMHVDSPNLMGEKFDEGDIDVDFTWEDTEAGAAGMDVQVTSAALRDGTGSVLVEASLREGGSLRGNMLVSGLPLGAIDAFGDVGKRFDGSVSMVGELGGTIDAPTARFDVTTSPTRLGRATLPASRFLLAMEPRPNNQPVERTACGNPRGKSWDQAAYDRDEPSGRLRLSGQLWGGQIRFDDLTVTQQRAQVIRGNVVADDLDVGALLGAIPEIAFAVNPPKGRVSALVEVRRLPVQQPQRADASLVLRKIDMSWSDLRLSLSQETNRLWLVDDELTVPDIRLALSTAGGARVDVTVGGEISNLATAPDLALDMRVDPIRLERLAADVEGIESASGELAAKLSVKGPVAKPAYAGAASLRGGSVRFTGQSLGLDDVDVDVIVESGEIRVVRGTAQVGGGTVAVTGRLPLEGLGFGTATAEVTAKGVRVPLADGIELTADANIEASYRPPSLGTTQKSIPEVRGTVSIVSFRYTRPIALSLDLARLSGQKPKRTEVQAYDPDGDQIRFEIDVVAPQPLAFQNNLMDMRLEVVEPGITVAGTDQRFGARGTLRVLPESKLQLRNHQFDVREGTVRFENLERFEPEVDIRAETEFRRYASSNADEGAEAAAGAGASAGATSGQWDITLRARGEIDALKLELSSDPPLSQDDILLLLTVGMTRAEVDRSLLSSVGETVGLEVLSQATGADRAVKSAVPIIDYFHFGSSYSSTTGRTEPNVTVGKRLSEDVRASVTTTLTERDVSTSLEWRLSRIMSVLGSYDNSTTEASSLGNLGADLRWRLEFE